MIEVKKCDDGSIEFIEDGEHLYDLFISTEQSIDFWLYHMHDKSWFTDEVRSKLIEASGSQRIENQ